MIIIHNLVQKMLLPCLRSKRRVSYNLLGIGIILLPDYVMCLFVFVCLFIGWLVCVQTCECRQYIYILLNIHGVSDIRQSEIQTPETLLPEPTSCGAEFAIAKSKI